MTIPFNSDKGILQILLERILSAFPADFDKIVVATTTSPNDDEIEEICHRLSVKCFRGSENDVLDRFISAAKTFGASKVVRVCADNVFLDVEELRDLYNRLKNSDRDYESYQTSDGTPSIRTHYGFWAEGAALNALEKAKELTEEPFYHEHVTNFIYGNPDLFKINLKPLAKIYPTIESYPYLRLTVDTRDDFDISRKIYNYFIENDKAITVNNLLSYIDSHAELTDKMKEIINQNKK